MCINTSKACGKKLQIHFKNYNKIFYTPHVDFWQIQQCLIPVILGTLWDAVIFLTIQKNGDLNFKFSLQKYPSEATIYAYFLEVGKQFKHY